jgi:BlaI family penicillinase repressor
MGEREAAISDAEWDLLDALWEHDAATAREVADALRERRGWARTTVKTLLERMVAKGLVEGRRVGPVVEYRAAVKPAEARRTAWRRFVDAAFGGSLSPALEFLAKDAKLTAKQRATLRRLLEEDGDE